MAPRADHHAARRRLLLGPGRGLINMLSPPQEMLRPFIGNLKSRRVLMVDLNNLRETIAPVFLKLTAPRARLRRDEVTGDFLEFQFTDGTVFRIALAHA
jgi:hypothetical protein